MTLAVFRIGLGMVVLGDLAVRTPEFYAHYSNGVLSRTTLPDSFAAPYSLYLLSDNDFVRTVVFGLTWVSATAFTVGYRTPATTLVLWLLLVSLHACNPFVLSNGDTLMALLLLWSAFLPVSHCLSLDAGAARRDSRPGSCVSIASAGILIQVALVLLTSGLSKLASASWTTHGLAIEHALHMRATALGRHLLLLPPAVLSAATRIVLAMEIAIPFVLFVPSQRLRTGAIALGMALMVGIAMTLNVGPLPLATACGLILFLPASTWSVLGASQPPHSRRPDRMTGVPTTGVRGWARRVVCLWLLATIVAYSVRDIEPWRWQAPVLLEPIARRFGLRQGWQMFVSPRPRAYWLAIEGRLISGTQVDPRELIAGELGAEHPARPVRGVLDYRRLRLEESILIAADTGLREEYARFLCASWNDRAAEDRRLLDLTLYAAWLEYPARGSAARHGTRPLGWYRCREPDVSN